MKGKGTSRLQTIVFDKDIIADGNSYKVEAKKFVGNGRITEIKAKFYAGEENTLIVKPVLVDAQGTEDPLIETVGDKERGYISGENDLIEMSIDTPFQKGDMLRIWAVNNSTALENSTYPIKVWITYYYEGVE